MKTLEFIRGGRGSDFDFLLKIVSPAALYLTTVGRIMRFYVYRDDYVGFMDIKYVAYECHDYFISIEIPWSNNSTKIIRIQKDLLKKKKITYRTSFSPLYGGGEEKVSDPDE